MACVRSRRSAGSGPGRPGHHRRLPRARRVGRRGRDEDLVLDGEIVALSGARPDFATLQRRMPAESPPARLLAAVPVTLIVFDLLRAGSRSLLRNPQAQRRALLDGLGLTVPGVIEVPPAFPDDAAALLRASRDQGYEGIMLIFNHHAFLQVAPLSRAEAREARSCSHVMAYGDARVRACVMTFSAPPVLPPRY